VRERGGDDGVFELERSGFDEVGYGRNVRGVPDGVIGYIEREVCDFSEGSGLGSFDAGPVGSGNV
jgi:hypothetical protein